MTTDLSQAEIRRRFEQLEQADRMHAAEFYGQKEPYPRKGILARLDELEVWKNEIVEKVNGMSDTRRVWVQLGTAALSALSLIITLTGNAITILLLVRSLTGTQ